MKRQELPSWLWLGFPPLMIVSMLVVRAVDADLFHRWFEVKEGPIEWATFAVLLPGIALGVLALRHWRFLPGWMSRAWLLTVLAGACYFAGEEISWGQHLTHVETPEALMKINRQQELNLHNISGWFNEKPRLLLENWVLIGGIVLPLLRRRRGVEFAPSETRAWFWPTFVCLPTAVLAILVRLPDHIERLGPKISGLRVSELQEYLFALFLALYLASFHSRLARLVSAAAPARERAVPADQAAGSTL